VSAIHRTTASLALHKKMRPLIAATLPSPCIQCHRPVLPDHPWQVGHILDAALHPDLALDPSNLGPVHRVCNARAGGKLGTAIQGKRKVRSDDPGW
jgi:5-methylcytosine-specific restriction endonuclease McrA